MNEEEQSRQLQARKPMTPREFYNKVLSYFEFFHALRCVKLVLEERRGTLDNEALAQCISWFGEDKSDFFLDGGPDPDKKLRQAVAEMIDKAKQGKSEEDGRRMCREMAADMMHKVHGFTKWVNGDQDYWEIPAKFLGNVPDDKECPTNYLYDTKTLEAIGVNVSKIKKDYLLVSAAEKAWLRMGMMYDSSSREPGLTPLEKYFQFYYRILKDIARFWAAQLLELGIDMQELERETRTEFEHHYLYYVDFIPNDERCDCCVYNPAKANELLDKIRREEDDENTKLKAIFEYVGKLKDLVKEEYATVYDEIWQEILKKESVKSKVYEKGKQQDTIFNRNLVANIIKLMNDKGIFKVGTNPTNMARLLDPKRGENSPVREPLGSPPAEKSVRKDVEDVIAEYHNKTNAIK